MPDPTAAHRGEARRAITLAGFPPPADDTDRARRTTLVDAVAAAIATAEARGSARPLPEPVRELLERIENAANEFPTGADGWRWWQETAEELAAAVTASATDPDDRRAAASDRLSWHGGEGLVITPPTCNAYYGVGDGTAAYCIRPAGHPEVSEDGIGHADAKRLQSL